MTNQYSNIKFTTMKQFALSISLLLIAANSFGQWTWGINFEDPGTLDKIKIDTVSNPNNTWQIGNPNKTLFNAANSEPNVIVTDTINPYPPNDTSSFTVIHIAEGGWVYNYPKVDIGGWYFVDSDSLTDYGYIDYSPDLGNTWYLVDSTRGACTWGAIEDLPTFTGNSNGWKHFYYCLEIPQVVSFGDTILYRFNFISDSVQTNKDGLMFDDLQFEDWIEGVPEIQNDNLIKLFPNPTSDVLRINSANLSDYSSVQIFNYLGQVMYDNPKFNEETIETRFLPNGIYLLKYSDLKNFAVKTFEVEH